MDLSGLKWPLIIAAVVGIGWLATSGGVSWMYGNFTKAAPGADMQQDLRDEAGLTKLASYTYHLWKWEKTIYIIETAMTRYGEAAPNYWFNLERLSTCYERIGNYQMSYDILQQLMNTNAHEIDERVGNFDNLNLRASKLKEMYELPLMHDRDTVIGRIPVLECLRARRRKALQLFLLDSGKDLGEIRHAARGIPILDVPRQELEKLAGGGTHQGVVLQASPLPIRPLNEWLARPLAPDAILVILDCIEDPHNFGAIVRSAAACGAAGVLFGKDRSAPLSPAAMKSAAGAMEHIDLIQAPNIARAADQLKKHEFWVAALMPDGNQTLWDANLRGRIALVIGNEGRGVRPLVEKQCDLRLRIPLSGPITSLNASVSAAIALAECLRQRQAG